LMYDIVCVSKLKKFYLRGHQKVPTICCAKLTGQVIQRAQGFSFGTTLYTVSRSNSCQTENGYYTVAGTNLNPSDSACLCNR